MNATSNIVLASASPRRRELLESIGLEFEIRTSDIPEERLAGESVRSYVQRLAREKAEAVSTRIPDAWVIAADTVVYLDEIVLEKPVDRDEAVAMLEKLAGRTHSVFSGVTLMNASREVSITEVVRTEVTIMPLEREIIEWYADTGEPMDKAGAYAIQGQGAMFVERIDGSYTNVVGLPLPTLFRMMKSVGISPLRAASTRSSQ